MADIGNKIKELRHQKRLTQNQVAMELGVSCQAVSKWENNLSCPDIMLLPSIAKLFDISIDKLFFDEREE